MKIEQAIEIGKNKVRNGYVSDQFNNIDDKVFAILGYTEADYYGTDEITELKKRFDKENEFYDMKFYKYVDLHLEECSFGEAISTTEYKQDDIFIFSELEDDSRKYYLTKIINNH